MTNCFLIKWRRNRIYTTGTKIIRMGNVCQEDGRAPGASQGAKGMFLRRHRWWWVLQPSSRTSIVSRKDLPKQSSSSSFFNIKSHLIRAAQDNGWWSPIRMCTSKKSFTWTRAKRQTLPLLILMDMTKTWSRRLFLLLHKMAGSLKSANRVNTKHYVHNRICMNGIRRMGFCVFFFAFYRKALPSDHVCIQTPTHDPATETDDNDECGERNVNPARLLE